MNKRLYLLRKNLNFSQEEFGARLGVTGASISRLEKGERKITEQMVISICREFNLSRLWLVDGVGEMFMNIPETILDELALQYELSDEEKSLVKKFCTLTKEHRKILLDLFRE